MLDVFKCYSLGPLTFLTNYLAIYIRNYPSHYFQRNNSPSHKLLAVTQLLTEHFTKFVTVDWPQKFIDIKTIEHHGDHVKGSVRSQEPIASILRDFWLSINS